VCGCGWAPSHAARSSTVTSIAVRMPRV
jgi:hypothetical protein